MTAHAYTSSTSHVTNAAIVLLLLLAIIPFTVERPVEWFCWMGWSFGRLVC